MPGLLKVIANPNGDLASNIGPDGKPLIIIEGGTPLTLGAVALPFYHPNIKYGDKGPAVQALQTLMHAALGKYTKSKVDGVYGPLTDADVHRFKVQNPRVGYSSNGKLWELEDWIIAKNIVLSHTQVLKYLDVAAHPPKPPPAVSTRTKLLNAAKYGYAHRMNMHYAEVRPMPSSLTLAASRVIYTDCSTFATLVYKMAGQPDPNGFRYNGYGFTGTLINHGRRVAISALQPGDLIFYGVPTIVHVSVAAGGGMCYSDGLYPMQYAPVDLWGGLPVNHARSYV